MALVHFTTCWFRVFIKVSSRYRSITDKDYCFTSMRFEICLQVVFVAKELQWGGGRNDKISSGVPRLTGHICLLAGRVFEPHTETVATSVKDAKTEKNFKVCKDVHKELIKNCCYNPDVEYFCATELFHCWYYIDWSFLRCYILSHFMLVQSMGKYTSSSV